MGDDHSRLGMTRVCFLISLVSSCAFGAAPDFLLPDGVVPTRHAIEMTIVPSRASFNGRARIDLELAKPQTEIWVNGKDLVVQEAAVEYLGKTRKARTELASGEFIGLTLDEPIGPGRATLAIRYRAPLSQNSVSGPFRKQVDGRWYAFTVFTPIDARRAFPCFDEPRFKTPWEISIRVKRTQKAFANAPQISETDEPAGMKLVRFAPAPPLPSEVIAFAVGPFDVWTGPSAGDKHTPVRVITAKGHAAEGEQAALATASILPRLEAYTGIAYPWDKLDHIALPQGAFGATENPGLITYRSRVLLVAPGSESPDRLQPLRAVQAHEIGHQWFGNLVTQASWQDVWLSEGFATWFAAKIMDQYQPEARRHLALIAARERIMAVDAGPNTRPVRLTMRNRDDTKSVYGQMVYQKGAAVLMMLEAWLGEDNFQRGMRSYLHSYALGNATTDDFTGALASATGIDATPVIHSFLDRTAIPVVRASVDCRARNLVFEQTGSNANWTIPVCWRSSTESPSCIVLSKARQEVPLRPDSTCPSWILPNAGGSGYYRTAWTGEQVHALAGALDRLTAAERLTLAYDLASLRKQPSSTASTVQPLLTRLTLDDEPEVAHAAKVGLGLEAEVEPARRQ